MLLTACGLGDNAEKPGQGECSSMACPVGTSPYETKSLTLQAVDGTPLVNVSDGPSEESAGSIGYVLYTEESCSFACVAIEPCPSNSVPIITRDCYTCAPLDESGDIASASCDYDSTYVESTGTTSPTPTDDDEDEDTAPPEDDEVPGNDDQAPSCRTSWRYVFEGDFDGNGSQDREFDDQLDEPQIIGELDSSLFLEGWLDRDIPAEPDCTDVDVYEGEYTCEGTASLLIETSRAMSIEVEIGGTTYSRSQGAIEVTPGPFRVTATCTTDWGGYDVEVRFGD